MPERNLPEMGGREVPVLPHQRSVPGLEIPGVCQVVSLDEYQAWVYEKLNFDKEIKNLSIIHSRTMSVCLNLKISVTTKPIGLYSSGNIPTCSVMVLS